jgi:hypothetical protein
MAIATEVRAYADAALKQGKTALKQAGTAVNTASDRVVELVEDAPKPAFAVLGAADLAIESVAKHLPRGATDVYLSTARDVYSTLTARGEAKIAALRNDPRLAKLLGDVNGAAETLQAKVAPVAHTVQDRVAPLAHSVQDRVAPLAHSVQDRVAPVAHTVQDKVGPVIETVKSANPVRMPAGRTVPVRKAPATKAPARKAPARKAPARKAQAKKAPAAEATPSA